jgi:hypothetical protein
MPLADTAFSTVEASVSWVPIRLTCPMPLADTAFSTVEASVS